MPLASAQRVADCIAETIREGVAVVDRSLAVHSVNEAFRRMFDLALGSTEGRTLDELGVQALADAALRRAVTQLPEGGRAELRLATDGDERRRRLYAATARGVAGTDSVVLVITDVTETLDAENLAKRIVVGFREILMNAGKPLVMVDHAGNIQLANRLAAALFGYEPEELTGLPVETLVPEPLRATHARDRARYAAESSPRAMGAGRALQGRRKDGSLFPVEIALSPFPQVHTGPRVVAFISDLTQRRAAERKIAEYQDALQRMSFDAALTEERERRRIAVELHDRIGQSLALTQIKLTHVRGGVAEASLAEFDQAVALVSDSIAETRMLTFDLSPPVLYDLGLNQALEWLAEDLEKRHGLKISVVDELPAHALDDATKAVLFRAVRELLLNVLKHAGTPSARIVLQGAPGALSVTVEDDGVGFDAAAERGKESFGLLSVREQVRQLGGVVEIASAPREGTRVTLRLPVTVAGGGGNPPEVNA